VHKITAILPFLAPQLPANFVNTAVRVCTVSFLVPGSLVRLTQFAFSDSIHLSGDSDAATSRSKTLTSPGVHAAGYCSSDLSHKQPRGNTVQDNTGAVRCPIGLRTCNSLS